MAVETTADMLDAVVGELEENAVLIMAAAPADYSPVVRSDRKMKKVGRKPHPRAEENAGYPQGGRGDEERDGRIRDIFTVGFAAETNNIEEYALKKLSEKNLDMICLNDVSQKGAGFGSDTNIITIFIRNGTRKDLPLDIKAGGRGPDRRRDRVAAAPIPDIPVTGGVLCTEESRPWQDHFILQIRSGSA